MAVNVNNSFIDRVNVNGSSIKTVIVNGTPVLFTADKCYGCVSSDPEYSDKSNIVLTNLGYNYNTDYVLSNNKSMVVVMVTVPSSITISKITAATGGSGTFTMSVNNTVVYNQSTTAPVTWTGSISGGGSVIFKMDKGSKNGKGYLGLSINDAPVVFW